MLASSGGESARVAGALGLPLAANYHVSPSNVLGTVEAYRAAFRPGVLAEPYVVVSADVLAAETTERAQHLADPFAEWVLSIRRGAQGAIAYPEPRHDDAVGAAQRRRPGRAARPDRHPDRRHAGRGRRPAWPPCSA